MISYLQNLLRWPFSNLDGTKNSLYKHKADPHRKWHQRRPGNRNTTDLPASNCQWLLIGKRGGGRGFLVLRRQPRPRFLKWFKTFLSLQYLIWKIFLKFSTACEVYQKLEITSFVLSWLSDSNSRHRLPVKVSWRMLDVLLIADGIKDNSNIFSIVTTAVLRFCKWTPAWENTQFGSWPGPTQTRLYSYWRWLEAWNFVFSRKKRFCTIQVAKTKALISFAVSTKLICVFVFAYANCWFSHAGAQIVFSLYTWSLKTLYRTESGRFKYLLFRPFTLLKWNTTWSYTSYFSIISAHNVLITDRPTSNEWVCFGIWYIRV